MSTGWGNVNPFAGEHPDADATGVRLVYCTYCNKTHAVRPDEKPCAPGAWLNPEPIR